MRTTVKPRSSHPFTHADLSAVRHSGLCDAATTHRQCTCGAGLLKLLAGAR